MRKILVVILDLLFCLFFSVFVIFMIGGLYNFLNQYGIDIDFGGDKDVVLIPILLGLPIGNVIGLYIIKNVIRKEEKKPFIRYIISFLFSVIGIVLGVLTLYKISDKIEVLIFIPIIVTIFSWIGLNVFHLNKKNVDM